MDTPRSLKQTIAEYRDLRNARALWLEHHLEKHPEIEQRLQSAADRLRGFGSRSMADEADDACS